MVSVAASWAVGASSGEGIDDPREPGPPGVWWHPRSPDTSQRTRVRLSQTISIRSRVRVASATLRMCVGLDVITASDRRSAPSTTHTSTTSP